MKTKFHSDKHLAEIKRDDHEQQYYDWNAETLSLTCQVCGMIFRAKKRRNVCNLECARRYDGKSQE